jgi:hypothetical protein
MDVIMGRKELLKSFGRNALEFHVSNNNFYSSQAAQIYLSDKDYV